MDHATVTGVSLDPVHAFTKPARTRIELLAGLGVRGDAHLGTTVQHRSRVARDPSQPNLRQVHLIHAELHTELATAGFTVAPGDLGENITTTGIALLDLPRDTVLAIGATARVRITGLRNPCAQINAFQPGLLNAVIQRTPDGATVRKAGVMAVVLNSGTVQPGDPITAHLPPEPHAPLQPV
ncbi:MOSC domain-containing protein [Nocardiopsis ansamitocini]|uniref:MOSC domain-containing protein n=1 Tax=Nocardiopsis ansamitocini TaxID=1670832 RepID=A0A9W6UJ50_9ACTN|nr:MOSC domain-containing protein [Nocardiopsis ansamitocini]GLU48454.1 MOSC domain-containing protein [Nocardiopsis ansamitocini]